MLWVLYKHEIFLPIRMNALSKSELSRESPCKQLNNHNFIAINEI